MSKKKPDYDNPWKEILEPFFEYFLEFCYPEFHKLIDWTHKPEFLNNEFQKLIEKDSLSHRIVDKLVKVWLKEGGETWLLVHVEMQANRIKNFAERMYYYHALIFVHHKRPVISIAILGDKSPSWKPDFFGYNISGFNLEYRFPCMKILDYRSQWAMLMNSTNPFAIVIMAHLKMLETKKDVSNRLLWKFEITKSLFERGFDKKIIAALLRFIDILIQLPDEIEEEFRYEVVEYQKEKNMPETMIPWEKAAYKDGREKGRVEGRVEGREEGLEIGTLNALFCCFGSTLR